MFGLRIDDLDQVVLEIMVDPIIAFHTFHNICRYVITDTGLNNGTIILKVEIAEFARFLELFGHARFDADIGPERVAVAVGAMAEYHDGAKQIGHRLWG